MRTSWESSVLKVCLFLYIFTGLVIAGLNFGWAPRATEQAQSLFLAIWQFYENQFKTILIVICALLTLHLVRKKEVPRKRRGNLAGFIAAAGVVHIAGPLISRNPDLYFVAMPLPWSTAGLRLAVSGSVFYRDHFQLWGAGGVATALVFFAAIHAIVVAGTVLLGRRWQCSTLCLFNGFASEIFEPAFPLFGKRKMLGMKTLRLFAVLRWVLLGTSLVLTMTWLGVLIFDIEPGTLSFLETLETYKYLIVELLMAMLFWTVLVGRGYCYYCPLGTVLGWLGKAAGQKIITTKSECIDCGRCDSVCPLSIRIRDKAREGRDVSDSRCVGCGHCVDACPVQTLEYSTGFLERIRRA